MKAKVYVTIQQNVLDPQGSAAEKSLQTLGYTEVEKLRIGKFIELELNTTDRNEAEKRVKEMCEKLLANVEVEDYRFELEG